MLVKDIDSIKRLDSHGISTIKELAEFLPRKYYDFRTFTEFEDLEFGKIVAVHGRVSNLIVGQKSNTIVLTNNNGATMYITWFHSDYHFMKFTVGMEGYFAGKVGVFNNVWNIVNPIFCGPKASDVQGIRPIYKKFQGVSEKYLTNGIREAVGYMKMGRTDGPRDILAAQIGLPDYFAALNELHHPHDIRPLMAAKTRMAYEQIYDFYYDLKNKDKYSVFSSVSGISNNAETRNFINTKLPFKLTPGQERAVNTVIDECCKGNRLRSIISGDVGCGKTIVALISSLLMVENGYQSVILAPTLVLAKQHYEDMSALTDGCMFNGHIVRFGLLTGETKKRERKKLLTQLADGEIDILIGTHAVLSEDVYFPSLGMTIIDEEHKFGVQQKALLEEYDKAGVHHLSMTATPIPRSIAMSVYGRDLAVIPIETMPNGRKPVITKQCFTVDDAFLKIREEVNLGHQAYIVCPFIESSSSDKCKDVVSVAAAEEMLKEYIRMHPGFTPAYTVISGDMKQSEILENIDKFVRHEVDILISTTIVEVGVNVPNATAICIMSAGRFGLAALHQLRGRVGRSSTQSYCILFNEKREDRLDILCSTTNGFQIAEMDLKLRGPGDLTGVSQSGSSDIINLILSRPKLSEKIKLHFFKNVV